ncbi:uncharacterized protein C8R40DRAFT_1092123 [Lentinula edodes]|uniref:uncharacterized protein n=1 Tax=Lentinula edodes TaxID=5353 RepID=UPI001E8CF8B5|nr:uncharacterized protein C8R40DRAFT_1092123 [Lentinula edodes]KAH7878362.1 hypothetical protein C8R40DRAFT_1092123 [Lentinula edodes]
MYVVRSLFTSLTMTYLFPIFQSTCALFWNGLRPYHVETFDISARQCYAGETVRKGIITQAGAQRKEDRLSVIHPL